MLSEAWDQPEKFPHGDAPLMEYGSNQLCQVQPDVGDVYCHVFSHLQDFLKPEENTHMVHAFQSMFKV